MSKTVLSIQWFTRVDSMTIMVVQNSVNRTFSMYLLKGLTDQNHLRYDVQIIPIYKHALLIFVLIHLPKLFSALYKPVATLNISLNFYRFYLH